MRYVERTETEERCFTVDYDKEELTKILEELKNYGYKTLGHQLIGGNITRWPATKKTITRRVASRFKSLKKHANDTLLANTIVHHKENGEDYVTYDYVYEKLPDLYAYVDILVNDNVPTYRKYRDCFPGADNTFSLIFHLDQYLMEGLLNYINSPELTKHNGLDENEKYDYKGLNELYKRTLQSMNFNLVSVKKYLDQPEAVDAFSLQFTKKDLS